jgi:hypothetical protein
VRRIAAGALVAGLAATAWLFAVESAFFDFAFAVLSAFTWCFLLDRVHDTNPVSDPDGGVPLRLPAFRTVRDPDAHVLHERPDKAA